VVKHGTRVEVRNRFDGSWSAGFLIEDAVPDDTGRVRTVTVTRASDGMVLPQPFPVSEVRRERHRGRSTWWY